MVFAIKKSALLYLELLLKWFCLKYAEKTGVNYIDSTSIAVCHNVRRYSHKVFTGIAGSTKNVKGWIYGIKLHLVINNNMQIVGYTFTGANIDDRAPVENITQHIMWITFW